MSRRLEEWFGQYDACLGGPEFNPQQPPKMVRPGGIALVTPVLGRQSQEGPWGLLGS